jgi:hypothetical protein
MNAALALQSMSFIRYRKTDDCEWNVAYATQRRSVGRSTSTFPGVSFEYRLQEGKIKRG